MYRSSPMYIKQQPDYLNCAVQLNTALQPRQLLTELKNIEQQLGRQYSTIRYTERIIDLDIALYDNIVYNDDVLQIPHPKLYERNFVLQPLYDINPTLTLPNIYNNNVNITIKQCIDQLKSQQKNNNNNMNDQMLQRVLPLHNYQHDNNYYKLLPLQLRTYIMGILNITYDSFSDGGKYINNIDDTMQHVDSMIRDGCDIIDIGGESTRPDSKPLDSNTECNNILPIIDKIRTNYPTISISVDTYHSNTVQEVYKHNVQIINDISGGTLDQNMYNTVANTQLAYCCMHMRGMYIFYSTTIH